MTDSINTVEAYVSVCNCQLPNSPSQANVHHILFPRQLKQANVRLEKVRLKLDLLLEKKAIEKDIPPHKQCSTDNISLIPEQLEELKARYQRLLAAQKTANQELGEKIDALESKVASLPRI